jgi:hypothetical protein
VRIIKATVEKIEDFRKDDFVGSSGRYINGEILGERGRWKGQCKNF